MHKIIFLIVIVITGCKNIRQSKVSPLTIDSAGVSLPDKDTGQAIHDLLEKENKTQFADRINQLKADSINLLFAQNNMLNEVATHGGKMY